MPAVGTLLTFSLASLILIAIPGPAVLFVVGRSLALGRRGGLLSVIGNELGAVPLLAMVALGVGTIVAESVPVFTAIKIAGAAYLVWLGVQAIRHRKQGMDGADEVGRPPARSFTLIRQGFVVGVTNPKTMVFFVAVLPQFVDLRAGAVPVQLVVLGLVFLLIACLCDSVWALAASTARGWFARSPKRLAAIRATGGGMMIGLAGVLVATGSKS
ncbi:LysE family translocator [Pseudolysinimonas sp.]|uniref:LysE family translocator n=1 Tax=Pseudolysinimonas sp. TaxID=2680009 RepID=UPI003F815BDD